MCCSHKVRGFVLLFAGILSNNGNALVAAGPEEAGRAVETFSLREAFGVSHPEQIIDFDCAKPIDSSRTVMIGPDGDEVPYQVLRGGKVAVRTDLPANARRAWKLVAGKTPAPVKDGVKVREGKGYYEITNGLTGIRVPMPAKGLKQTPAPVQGVRLRDGAWTATGPNILDTSKSHPENNNFPAKAMEVRFLERGPLKVVVQVAYRFDRPAYKYGERVLLPGGDGFYTCTIEVQAGQPSILFEEDSDMDLTWSLDLHKGLEPDQARYRGHHASDVKYGREPDGRQYRQTHERGPVDATVDLTYDRMVSVGSQAGADTRRYLAVWDPWVYDSGWYWQMYNAKAPAAGNLVGIFAGRASRVLGTGAGVGVWNGPLEGGGRGAGVSVEHKRYWGGDHLYPRNRSAWGLFIATKAELPAADQIQGIGRQMNLHAGINLNKVKDYPADFADPPAGYGALYVERKILDRMIQRVRKDRAYYTYLYNAEPSARPLIDFWSDASGKQVKEVAGQINEEARELLAALVNGDGIYDFRYHYWMGGVRMQRRGVWIDQVLASDRLGKEDRGRVKSASSLFAHVLWDDDFVPLQRDAKGNLAHALNLGTPNMPVQYQGYRDFYALLLGADPAWRKRAEGVRQRALAMVRHIINEHGAHMGSTGYIGASIGPTLNTLLQLQMLGGKDPFATEPRLARFADFMLNLLTPPEQRFGGQRKVAVVGHGATQGSELYGVLATGFRKADPKLSARLMGAWVAQGKPHSGFFGTTLLTIDEEATAKDPGLRGSADFPGYYSVLRNGWGGKNETALWFINGDFYRDHRLADRGNVMIYALGAPLSTHWGGLYAAPADGAFLHSVVLPESATGHPWDKDSPPLNAGGLWQSTAAHAFLAFRASGFARARFLSGTDAAWTRSVSLIHPNEDFPIILLRDRCTHKDAAVSQVFSINLMAKGDVDTPAGKQTPKERSYWRKEELPSAGPLIPLRPGVNRFGFSGQGEIDFDLYTLSEKPQQAVIGNWAHNWHPEYPGQGFETRQHVLRIKGDGPSRVLILPHRKGKRRADVQVKRDGAAMTIKSGGETTTIGETYYAFHGPGKQVLATFAAAAAKSDKLRAAGGPVEVVVEGKRATITAHGEKGLRRIALPGAWQVDDKDGKGRLKFESGEWLLDYAGGPPLTVTLALK